MQQIQDIIQILDSLSVSEKAEVVKMIMSDIQNLTEQHSIQRKPLDSAYGICAGYPEPSEEDIAQMRKEVFIKFSERDI
ncbi:MAG: hypothetical protein GY749_21875 [Desulfobacteraceae bacterium]|nr:hypothetical protein [Desulfobacteraceae bacterium]